MTIEIVDYDPAWAELARHAIGEVIVALPGRVSEVEHVGSTAVPGLAAKPVIDLMAATSSLDMVIAGEAHLEEIGYRRLDTGMPNRLFYRREGTPVAYHLHVVGADSWETRNERLLRDHLLQTPGDRDEYADLKRELADLDAETYTRRKTPLVQRMVDTARDLRGLPRVDVWEE
ncbi:GrpB family protein [Actinoplanes sp. CA-015351]|uniref:GrpB family protein n=1 Tax=Actinoplanes sp. CA-015351 TaxID=3239897 RepID=UPI003D975B1A